MSELWRYHRLGGGDVFVVFALLLPYIRGFVVSVASFRLCLVAFLCLVSFLVGIFLLYRLAFSMKVNFKKKHKRKGFGKTVGYGLEKEGRKGRGHSNRRGEETTIRS